MINIRWISAGVAAGSVLLLSGCVAVPGQYGYDDAYYSQPAYYGAPAPAVAPVYIHGGTYYDGGYYNRGYYEARDHRDWRDGRRYGGREPDRGPRPGFSPGPRPQANAPGQGPRVNGRPPALVPPDRQMRSTTSSNPTPASRDQP